MATTETEPESEMLENLEFLLNFDIEINDPVPSWLQDMPTVPEDAEILGNADFAKNSGGV